MANDSTLLRVLVVDDDEDFLAVAVELVREAGGVPIRSMALDEALAIVRAGEIDAVLTDYQLSGSSGGDEIVRACHAGRRIPVAVISVVDSAAVAMTLVKLGADDYFLKPSSAAVLLPRIRTFLAAAGIARAARAVESAVSAREGTATNLLRASPALAPLLRDLPRAARSGANVLIGGESGTGKELAARAVHELSRRSAGPFVAIDCGAIPESLLENELFGHRKGAYSDAREDREGLVQRAEGGTLFLDEIGEMPLMMQAKLLRFMQTREYRRLGDARTSRGDVRFVAATHRDLRALGATGAFREDLYYRLNVIALRLLPLRERIADLPLLASAFLHRYAIEFESPALTLSHAAIDHLSSRSWPGNVRELENTIQRAVAMATGPVLDVDAFTTDEGSAPVVAVAAMTDEHASESDAGDEGSDFHARKQRVIERFERQYAIDLVRRNAGNLSAAAREARLDRKSLARLLARHALEVPRILGN